MSKIKVLVLGGLNEDALTELKKNCEVVMGPVGHRPDDDYEWLLNNISDYDAVIDAKIIIDKRVIDRAKRLKIISTFGVNYNFIDIDYAREKGIVVVNCPQSVLRPTAELALTMILACARRLHYYDNSMREGVFLDMNDYDNQGYTINGKTLGIIGMSDIGKLLARFSEVLGMKVIYYSEKKLDTKSEKELNAELVDLDTLLTKSDFVTLTGTLKDTYNGIIDARALKKMKETSFIVNVAQADMLDQAALISALRKGEIAGAGLDVFDDEEKVDEELASFDNVIITPHASSATHKARYDLTKEASKNILDYFEDSKISNQIN